MVVSSTAMLPLTVARAVIAMLSIVANYTIPKRWQTHRIHTHTAWSLCFNSSQVITLHDTKTLADAQNPPTKHTDRRVGLTPAYVLRGCVIPIDTRQYGTVLPCCLTPALLVLPHTCFACETHSCLWLCHRLPCCLSRLREQ